MPLARNPGGAMRAAAMYAVLTAAVVLSGCGMPGAPQPPSLDLPVHVSDLSAVRTGDQVALTWTMPTKTIDKVLLTRNVAVRVCRNELASTTCSAITTLEIAPGASASFTDTLPPALAWGLPHELTYFVELDNAKGRSAGLSNGAKILAGAAPPAVEGLTAEMRKDGVLLRWALGPPEAPTVAIRLVRKLLTPPAKPPDQNPLARPAEPIEQTLLVEPTAHFDRALDSNIRFGETYEYRAQRVVRLDVNGETLELASPLSAPVRIDAHDVFPPATPTGLVAAATVGGNGAGPSIDLSWLPNTEPDLAGYIVYRREGGEPASWQRVSPAQPIIGPGYHDATVQPGHAYQYAVSAIGQNGYESARSAEASDTVPGP